MAPFDAALTTNISPLIDGQVPDFIQADHPEFVKFLQEYYQFLESGLLVVDGDIDNIVLESPVTQNILLDIEGSKLNSVEFSECILDQADINQNINFFIGGSEGIDRKYFGDFDKIISFGDLTWPHKMFKMMLLEQIYRSITIINKHPYHK